MELHTEEPDEINERADMEFAYLDLDTEEWALVVEGLATVAGNPNRANGQEERAWKLVDAICEGVGLSAADILDKDMRDDFERRRTVAGVDAEFGAGRKHTE